MGVKGQAKDAAKRYLSPDAQEALKTLLRRLTGPRKPSRLKPVPTDPIGAARHAVLTAHASGRASDHVRARRAMGRVVLADSEWSVGLPSRQAPRAESQTFDVIVVGPAVAGLPDLAAVGTPADRAGADSASPQVLRIGLPGAERCDITVLPHAGDLLATLGVDEQAAVLAAAALGPLRGARIASAAPSPADDALAAAVSRSLHVLAEGSPA